jgi:hypothetical protein
MILVARLTEYKVNVLAQLTDTRFLALCNTDTLRDPTGSVHASGFALLERDGQLQVPAARPRRTCCLPRSHELGRHLATYQVPAMPRAFLQG